MSDLDEIVILQAGKRMAAELEQTVMAPWPRAVTGASGMSDLRWTTAPPTAPGFYWAMQPNGDVTIIERGSDRSWVIAQDFSSPGAGDFTAWAGPIVSPPLISLPPDATPSV